MNKITQHSFLEEDICMDYNLPLQKDLVFIYQIHELL